eukprot:3505325-Rhodomonas_salina.1
MPVPSIVQEISCSTKHRMGHTGTVSQYRTISQYRAFLGCPWPGTRISSVTPGTEMSTGYYRNSMLWSRIYRTARSSAVAAYSIVVSDIAKDFCREIRARSIPYAQHHTSTGHRILRRSV